MSKREIVTRFKGLLLEFPHLVKLVYRLMRDPRVSGFDKAALGAVALYVVNPLDLIPDVIPVIGQIDDAFLVALALLRLLNRADEPVVREHWDGSVEIVPLLNEIVEAGSLYLPAGMRRVLVGLTARPGSHPPEPSAESPKRKKTEDPVGID